MTPLRRTALARRTELKRTTPLQARTGLRRRAAAKRTVTRQRKRRDTGPDLSTRNMLWVRARGRCELCGRDLTGGHPFSRHHRRPRGMGGTSLEWVNDITNLLLLCGTATTPGGCHQMVESQRLLAVANGWLIPAGSPYLPAELPVLLAAFTDLVYLGGDGSYAKGAA